MTSDACRGARNRDRSPSPGNVITRNQLRAAGLGSGAIAHRLKSRAMQRMHTSVYLLGPSATDTDGPRPRRGPGRGRRRGGQPPLSRLPFRFERRLRRRCRDHGRRPKSGDHPGIKPHRARGRRSQAAGRHEAQRLQGHLDRAQRSAISPPPSPPTPPSMRSRRPSTAKSSRSRPFGPGRREADPPGVCPTIRQLNPATPRPHAAPKKERRLLKLITAAQLPKPLTNVPLHGYKADMYSALTRPWSSSTAGRPTATCMRSRATASANQVMVARRHPRCALGYLLIGTSRTSRSRWWGRIAQALLGNHTVLLPWHASPMECVTGDAFLHFWWRWRSPPC